jgi:hypothetical protein
LEHHDGNPAKPIEKPIKTPKVDDLVSDWDLTFIKGKCAGNARLLYDLMLVRHCDFLLKRRRKKKRSLSCLINRRDAPVTLHQLPTGS